MKKLWNRFKYWLLCQLLNDICNKSECEVCHLDKRNLPAWQWSPCMQADFFTQARKAWGILALGESSPGTWSDEMGELLEQWKEQLNEKTSEKD